MSSSLMMSKCGCGALVQRPTMKSAAHPCERCLSNRREAVVAKAGPKSTGVHAWMPATKGGERFFGVPWAETPKPTVVEQLDDLFLRVAKKLDALNTDGSKLWPVGDAKLTVVGPDGGNLFGIKTTGELKGTRFVAVNLDHGFIACRCGWAARPNGANEFACGNHGCGLKYKLFDGAGWMSVEAERVVVPAPKAEAKWVPKVGDRCRVANSVNNGVTKYDDGDVLFIGGEWCDVMIDGDLSSTRLKLHRVERLP